LELEKGLDRNFMDYGVAIKKTFLSEDSRFALTWMIFLTILFIGDVLFSEGRISVLLLFPVAILVLICVPNFELSMIVLVVTLFVNVYLFMYSYAVLFTIVLGLSLIYKYRNSSWVTIKNPLTLSIVLYGACALPSFVNADAPIESILLLFNVVAFLIIVYSMMICVDTYRSLKNAAIVYLVLTMIVSIDVVRLSQSGVFRPFGFAGIWFVDYSALAVCLAIAMAIVTHGYKRTILFCVASIITVALILTKTRNTWLSAFITLCVLSLYLLRHPDIVKLTRKQLFTRLSFGSLTAIVIVLAVIIFNPEVGSRATELTDKSGYKINSKGYTENSLVSRVFIWDTAINAFRSHPLVGIGVYGFPFSSQKYYRIPRILYYLYVKGSHPHQTHLAVLAETGIIGFVGFLFFVGTAVRCAFNNIKLAKQGQGKNYAFVAAVGVIYSTVSMFFTDAWLWGPQIVLLGLIYGSMLTIRKINQFIDEDSAAAQKT
jgi:O-antigen ligase